MDTKPTSPTAIVMLNMGGPATLEDVRPFLSNLFADREIMQLPAHSLLGPFIAKMRTPKVQRHYAKIGGGSPILRWTQTQGQGMQRHLDEISPQTAPHKFYIAFRYVHPFAEDALLQMKADGVKRAVAFTQYPQYSCSTTGSSLNDLWRVVRRLGLEKEFRWSVIDRWPVHPGFINAVARSIREGLKTIPPAKQSEVLLLFSAHSLPLDVIDQGDPYPQEIGASVHAVMQQLNFSNEYLLSYQSAVGPVRWLGPSTEDVIQDLGRSGRHSVLVVPIAFTSDHIETLYEVDIQYQELAQQAGIMNFWRAPSLNGDPGFQVALAEIVSEHLHRGELCTTQYHLRCPGCTNPQCRTIVNPALPAGHPNIGLDFTPENYPHSLQVRDILKSGPSRS